MRTLFILLVSFSTGHLIGNGKPLDLICAGMLFVALLLFTLKGDSLVEERNI